LPTISAKPVEGMTVPQRLIPTGEQSGLQMHTATMASGSLSTRMKS
jgi:hypothetical protein